MKTTIQSDKSITAHASKIQDKIPKLKAGAVKYPVLAFLAVGSFIGALFFISFSLTGSAIMESTRDDFNLMGLGLFILGLVFTFVYFRNKK